MSYFQNMGSVWYDMPDGSKLLINDITAFSTIIQSWRDNAKFHIPYSIKDGDLPHTLSYKLYGSVEYWWTILMINNIYDFDNQWPRSDKQLNEYMQRKYPGQDIQDVHHYINEYGLVADLISYRIKYNTTSDAVAIEAGQLEPVTIEEYEIAANDMKRQKILIDPNYIDLVQKEYEKSMEE